MKRIETLYELRNAWRALTHSLRRDFTAGRRLISDPVGAMREAGYELSPKMAHVLLEAAS